MTLLIIVVLAVVGGGLWLRAAAEKKARAQTNVHQLRLEAQQLVAEREAKMHQRRHEAEQAAAKSRAFIAEHEAKLARLRHEAEVALEAAVFASAVSRMEAAKGPAGRRGGLEAGLRKLREPHMKERLLLEASRVEVQAALEKAEGLKSPTARVRTLQSALDAVRLNTIPDTLKAQQIRSLEEAISKIEDEKNSIEEA